MPRSPELMSAADTALVVVDVQGKLAKLVQDHARILWNCRRLLDGAVALGVRRVGTEQYPRGLGPTAAELLARLPEPVAAKTRFSCLGCEELFSELAGAGIQRYLLCGIEAHVCVQQTALDLLSAGHRVYLAVDAIGSRHAIDKEIALRRMDSAGVTLTTTEAALFEWCEDSARAEFKTISSLIQELPPPEPPLV